MNTTRPYADNYNHLLAPMFEVVSYEDVHFENSLHHKSEYSGFPTEEVEKAWEALYNGLCE